MPDPFSQQIIKKIEQASGLYHRLVLVVAPSGLGKTMALRDVQHNLDVPIINVNLEISGRLLELTVRKRALQVAELLEEILHEIDSDVVLLDNVEILFDQSLQQDPLRLLQGLSRNRTIAAAWNGEIKENSLFYGAPGHPEYRRYAAKDCLTVSPAQKE